MKLRSPKYERQGAILPLITIMLVALLSMVALATDIGLLAVARSQAQSAADIGALSGARTLNGLATNNKDNAIAQARAAASQNYVLRNKIDPDLDIPEINCGMYVYTTDPKTGISRFQANFTEQPTSTDNYGAIQIRVETTRPTFFGKILGVNSMKASAISTAVHRPRDIAIVLDFSSSMKYASTFNYPILNANITGGLNPDDRFPRFGPWSIYPVAKVGIPNPMHCLDTYVDSVGYTYAPNNLTIETPHGPPMVNNFQTTAGNGAPNAFVYNNDLVGSSFNIKNTPICTPVPASWSNQYASGYAGDRWPIKLNEKTNDPRADQYAKNVADIIYPTGTSIGNSTYDANWETNGYDSPNLSFSNGPFMGYSMGPGYFGKTFYIWPPDPRYDPKSDPTNISTSNLAQDSAGKWICDWRKRFFLKPSTNSTVPGSMIDDNALLFDSSGSFKYQNIAGPINYVPNYPAILKWIRSGPQTLPPSMRAGRVLYYSAIPDTIPLDWKTGLISSSATLDQRFWKEYIDFVIGSGIHNRASTLYGDGKNNSNGTTTFGSTKITAKSSLSGTPVPYMHYQDSPIHPRAHLWFGPLTMLGFISPDEAGNAANQHLRTMYNWNAGTSYESHCWQLKAGINASLSDIKNNHPNDLASLIYFSAFATPRVKMGKDFSKMQKCLFYPNSLVDQLGNFNAEKRPYTTSTINPLYPSGLEPNNFAGDIPLAYSSTSPAMGLMNAYNQFNSTGSYTGRRGALKIVILETDGVANADAAATFSAISGGNGSMEWKSIAQGKTYNDGDPSAMDSTIALAWLIYQNSNSSKPWPLFPAYSNLSGLTNAPAPKNYYGKNGPGFSTPRSPSQVHTIAFGPLFEPETKSNMKTRALEFLRNVQIAGGTSPSNATSIENYKIIVGSYKERIDLLRQCMRSIMQGGVQVSLIQ